MGRIDTVSIMKFPQSAFEKEGSATKCMARQLFLEFRRTLIFENEWRQKSKSTMLKKHFIVKIFSYFIDKLKRKMEKTGFSHYVVYFILFIPL